MTNRILADIVHCSMSCALFSLDSFNTSCIFPCTQASTRSFMPLKTGGLWISGYFAYDRLPRVKVLIINCQASEQPDCTWMLHGFLFNMSPGNSSSIHQSCSSQAPRESQEGGCGHRCWDHLFQSWLQEPADESDPCLRSSMQTSVVMVFEFVTHLLQTSWRHCSDVVCHIYFIWTTPGWENWQIGFWLKATSTCCGSTATADATGHRRWHPFYGQCPARSRMLKQILGWISCIVAHSEVLFLQWQQSERQPSFECN